MDKSPAVKAWDRSDLGARLDTACLHWLDRIGLYNAGGYGCALSPCSGVEGLLRRIGAISELAGMRYWSTTHKRWQTLIVSAYALPGPAGGQRRKDFSPDEMEEGKCLYFQQEDNLSGKAIYRMRIQSVSPDRLVFDTENISTVRYLLWPLFRPGEMQSIYFLERESQDVWRYYSITRTGRNASTLTAGHDASSINRAVAFYRSWRAFRRTRSLPLRHESVALQCIREEDIHRLMFHNRGPANARAAKLSEVRA